MSPAKVTVTLLAEETDSKEFTFENSARCIVGRAQDCDIQVANSPALVTISRHHCVLDIDPPMVTVQDLQSRNGTYVNGEKISRPSTPSQAEQDRTSPDALPPRELRDGDEIRVGDAVLRVGIVPSPEAQRTMVSPWNPPFFQ
jgi:eukaryotic-like serine/threonine-protein kinase